MCYLQFCNLCDVLLYFAVRSSLTWLWLLVPTLILKGLKLVLHVVVFLMRRSYKVCRPGTMTPSLPWCLKNSPTCCWFSPLFFFSGIVKQRKDIRLSKSTAFAAATAIPSWQAIDSELLLWVRCPFWCLALRAQFFLHGCVSNPMGIEHCKGTSHRSPISGCQIHLMMVNYRY